MLDKIKLIKQLRNVPLIELRRDDGSVYHSIGLKDAKDFVEAVIAEVQAEKTPVNERTITDVVNDAAEQLYKITQALSAIHGVKVGPLTIGEAAYIQRNIVKMDRAVQNFSKDLANLQKFHTGGY